MADFPGTEPIHAVGRQTTDSRSFTALSPAFENRTIVLCQGTQFTTAVDEPEHPKNLLEARGLVLDRVTDDFYFHTSDVQRVNFFLFIVRTKAAFKQALLIPGLHVIYAGHARHGQGACFHQEGDAAGEWWNNGENDDNGIFRFGYPLIAIPAKDVVEHGYHATMLPATVGKPSADPSQLHPKLLQNYGAIKPMTIQELISGGTEQARLAELVGGTGPFWGLKCNGDDGVFQPHFMMPCGWENTPVAPMDLGATDIACKVFADFGCSTLIHNAKVVRRLKGFTKEGDDHYAYWTDAAAPPIPLVGFWLFHLFTFPKDNAFLPWEASLEYARGKSNQETPKTGHLFRVI
jgi:hypothetical protein